MTQFYEENKWHKLKLYMHAYSYCMCNDILNLCYKCVRFTNDLI